MKDDVELWRNISSFDIHNESNTSCMLRRYTKINVLSWFRCPFWNQFFSTLFGIWDERRQYKGVRLFHSSMSCIDGKRYNSVRPDLSGQLLTTAISNFIGYSHNYVVTTSVKQIISFKSMIWARYVTVFIMH